MYKFVLTWWKNSIKQCFCHQELPCCLISTSSPALNNKTSFAQVMMVQVGTVTTLLVLFGGTVNDYILFMVEHWSCFAKNWGGEGGQKMSSKKVRERVQGQKSPQIPFLYTREGRWNQFCACNSPPVHKSWQQSWGQAGGSSRGA